MTMVKLCFLIIVSALFFILPSLACKPPDGQTSSSNNTSLTSPNYTYPNPPPPQPSGNTKVSSALKELEQAQRQGNAELLARQNGLVLKNGSVFVTITCAPGHIQAAANVTVNAGGKLASGLDFPPKFAAYVPINSLESLAAANSIWSIAEPAPIAFP